MENPREFYEQYGHRKELDPVEREYDRLAAEWKVSVLTRLLPTPPGTVLEYGCGSGEVLRALRQAWGNDVVLTGIDISQAQLDLARAVVSDATFLLGGESLFSALDTTYDVVLLVDILEHLSDPVELLRRATEVGDLVMVKIPVEHSIVGMIRDRLSGTRPENRLGAHHMAGHLVEWNLQTVRSLLFQARLQVVAEQTADAPASIRYYRLFSSRRRRKGPIRGLASLSNQVWNKLLRRLSQNAQVNYLRPLGHGLQVIKPKRYRYLELKKVQRLGPPPLASYAEGVRLPVSEEVARRILSLPVHPGLTGEDLGRVVGAVRLALDDVQSDRAQTRS